MRFVAVLIGVFALSGCDEPGTGHAPAPENPSEPPAVDTCGAEKLGNLIGAPKSDVEAMTFTQPVRIIGPGDAVTMDYSPVRINFMIDDTKTVTDITCG